MSASICVRADRVLPMTGDLVIQDGAVVIEGDRITYVGEYRPEHSLGRPCVEYAGTLLPGLVDAHCHVTLSADGRTYEAMAAEPDEMMALVAVRNLEQHLKSGVTTIRDNGRRNKVVFSVREAARRGLIVAPHMLLSGRPITHRAGHFHWCNGVADSDAEIRATVRQLVAEGADHIKLMASGGGSAGNIPFYPSYTTEELRVAVETAHGLGRLTTAHCRAKSSMVNAMDAGLDCIEHGEFLVRGPETHFGGGVVSAEAIEYDSDLAKKLADAGLFLSYTFQAGGYSSLKRLRYRKLTEPLTDAEAGRLAFLEHRFACKGELFSKLLDDGIEDRLVVSTDAGPFDGEFGRLVDGLRLAVAAGMSPFGAIRSVTARAADACGVAHLSGTLEPGKLADLVVVDGDPTADIEALGSVVAVYLAGQVVTEAAHVDVRAARQGTSRTSNDRSDSASR